MRALVVVVLSLLVVAPALAVDPPTPSDGAPPSAKVSTTLLFADGHVTYVVTPRASDAAGALALLAFPRTPEARPLAPAAVSALGAVSALEPLPPAEDGSKPLEDDASAVTLLQTKAALDEWRAQHPTLLDDKALARAAAFLDAGWKLVLLRGTTTTPAFGFRLPAEGPLAPPDLLTLDDDGQRALLDAKAPSRDEGNRVLRLLHKVWGD